MNQNTVLVFLVLLILSSAVQCNMDEGNDEINEKIGVVIVKSWNNGFWDGAEAYRKSIEDSSGLLHLHMVDSLEFEKEITKIVKSWE